MNITKEEYRDALIDNRIYITVQNKTNNGHTLYRVYWLPLPKSALDSDNRLLEIRAEETPYWSKRHKMFHCTAWGTSRPLELILSIGYELGLNFHDIKQRYQVL